MIGVKKGKAKTEIELPDELIRNPQDYVTVQAGNFRFIKV